MPVQDVAVGSVMHPLSVVTSVLRAGTVETIPGMEDNPLKQKISLETSIELVTIQIQYNYKPTYCVLNLLYSYQTQKTKIV